MHAAKSAAGRQRCAALMCCTWRDTSRAALKLSALADGEDYLHAHLSRIFPRRICSTIRAKLLVHPKALAQQRTTEISDGCGNLQALACCSPLCRKLGAVSPCARQRILVPAPNLIVPINTEKGDYY